MKYLIDTNVSPKKLMLGSNEAKKYCKLKKSKKIGEKQKMI